MMSSSEKEFDDWLRAASDRLDAAAAELVDVNAELDKVTRRTIGSIRSSTLAVHQTICTVDVAGYGGTDRIRANHVALRSGMYESLEQAFAESDIAWADCFHQGIGDSLLVLAPMTIPKGAFAGPLPDALTRALVAHNETHSPEERIRLRMALHAGEVRLDEYGVGAPAVVHAARLLNTQSLEDALAASRGPLAVITSDWFYKDVISQHPEYAPETYRRVPVDVRVSEGVGWIRLPGDDLPPNLGVDPGTRRSVGVALRPATAQFYEVVDALENIPCMQNTVTRSQVVDQLRFGATIRYFASRRAHITSILRSSLDVEDGVRELMTAIANQEPGDSVPLKRLLALLTGGRL